MKRFHDVHVYPSAKGRGWRVAQGRRTLSAHRLQSTALRAAKRRARRDHVELLTHGRDGRVRVKDSYGRDSQKPDSHR
jgi:hypothetical protein